MVTQDKEERKNLPITTGVLDYFPDALLEVARCSKVGNDQHNPGEPLHWAKEKSTDEPDALVRHLLERGTMDTDGVRHSAKVAWRALAMLQREIEAERTTFTGTVTEDDLAVFTRPKVHGPEFDHAHYSWQCKPDWPCWPGKLKTIDDAYDQHPPASIEEQVASRVLGMDPVDPDDITGVPA